MHTWQQNLDLIRQQQAGIDIYYLVEKVARLLSNGALEEIIARLHGVAFSPESVQKRNIADTLFRAQEYVAQWSYEKSLSIPEYVFGYMQGKADEVHSGSITDDWYQGQDKTADDVIVFIAWNNIMKGNSADR